MCIHDEFNFIINKFCKLTQNEKCIDTMIFGFNILLIISHTTVFVDTICLYFLFCGCFCFVFFLHCGVYSYMGLTFVKLLLLMFNMVWLIDCMLFNANFSYISAISWPAVNQYYKLKLEALYPSPGYLYYLCSIRFSEKILYSFHIWTFGPVISGKR